MEIGQSKALMTRWTLIILRDELRSYKLDNGKIFGAQEKQVYVNAVILY